MKDLTIPTGPVVLFEKQARSNPERIAVVYTTTRLTYRELNERAGRLGNYLREKYMIKPGAPVAIMARRTERALIGLLGILKSGGGCVPLDPGYSKDRIEYILEDSGATVILVIDGASELFSFSGAVLHYGDIACDHITSGHIACDEISCGHIACGHITRDPIVCDHFACENISFDHTALSHIANDYAIGDSVPAPENTNRAEDLFYLLYGTEPVLHLTKRRLSQGNILNLLKEMDGKMPADEDNCMLAISKLNIEASIPELFWPLCTGKSIILHPEDDTLYSLDRYVSKEPPPVDFSLFFFSSYTVEENDKYRLLLESVKYADRAGFRGVWVPERHFHEFGALFPNPSVISSALAVLTKQITLRSGSIVSPLHDVIRIAEEWAAVDNLSGGRVELSFAPGWNINDFALSRDSYKDRHGIMHEQIDIVKRLWRGEKIKRLNGVDKEIEVGTFPLPVQKELPVWLTAAGNEATFVLAGEKGANILTHLLGQDMQELSAKIKLYREARKRCGYDEMTGKVAIMLHTYVGNEIGEVEQTVEKPFIEYLKSAIGLSKILYEEAGLKEEDIPLEDREIMLKHSFQRYYKSSALIGTKSSCIEMVRRLHSIGVDEIACLVDFGIEYSKVMEGLRNLKVLQELFATRNNHAGLPVTMLQASPAVLELIREEPASGLLLQSLRDVFHVRWQSDGGAEVISGIAEDIKRQKDFWAQKLSGELPEVHLPVTGPGGEADSEQMALLTLEITGSLFRKMENEMPGSVLSGLSIPLSVYYILLSKITEQNDIIIGYVTDRKGDDVNLLPVRITVPMEGPFDRFLAEVEKGVRDALDNQVLRYDQIRALAEDKRRKDVVDVWFSYEKDKGNGMFWKGWTDYGFGLRVYPAGEGPNIDFELRGSPAGDGLNIDFVYRPGLYDAATIALFKEYYCNILVAVLEEKQIDIENIGLENEMRTT